MTPHAPPESIPGTPTDPATWRRALRTRTGARAAACSGTLRRGGDGLAALRLLPRGQRAELLGRSWPRPSSSRRVARAVAMRRCLSGSLSPARLVPSWVLRLTLRQLEQGILRSHCSPRAVNTLSRHYRTAKECTRLDLAPLRSPKLSSARSSRRPGRSTLVPTLHSPHESACLDFLRGRPSSPKPSSLRSSR